jgi:hypothetical protein
MDDTLIAKLAEARMRKASIKDAMQMIVKEVTSTIEYKEFEVDLQHAVQAEAEALQAVNDAAFVEFEKDGNKHPHETITIKEYQIAEIIDQGKAREWCFVNYRPALTLDEKAFSSAAKQGLVPEEFVVVSNQYKATIAQNLEKYLSF